MTRIILSTSNITARGTSVTGRPIYEKSNTELTKGLRANFVASREELALQHATNGNGKVPEHSPHPSSWIKRDGDYLYVPSLDSSSSGLAEERSQYDITVKLFFLPTTVSSRRCQHTKDAINLVLQQLGVPSIDLLIVSFPGITFDAEDDEELEENEGGEIGSSELEDMVATWRTLESLKERGIINQLGLSEFGSERLKTFLPHTKIRPSVDQINVRDCCVVPKSLILFAKQEKIELLTHNDCTDILPKGTIRELLEPKAGDTSELSGPVLKDIRGEIEPQWVIKYTVVVHDRGVIENKGYFAMADAENQGSN